MRHLEASGRHLGAGVVLGGIWEPNVFKHLCLSAKVARGTISRRRHELDLHVDRKFTATLSERGPPAEAREAPPSPKSIRQNPYSVNTVWGEMPYFWVHVF